MSASEQFNIEFDENITEVLVALLIIIIILVYKRTKKSEKQANIPQRHHELTGPLKNVASVDEENNTPSSRNNLTESNATTTESRSLEDEPIVRSTVHQATYVPEIDATILEKTSLGDIQPADDANIQSQLREQPDGSSLKSVDIEARKHPKKQTKDLQLINRRLERSHTVAAFKMHKSPFSQRAFQQDFRDSGYFSVSSIDDLTSVPCGGKNANSKTQNRNIISATEMIGPNGGTIAVAGCSLLVPKDALLEEKNITMRVFLSLQDESGPDSITVTPTVSLEPTGLQFTRKVVVSLPTSFYTKSNNALCDILIEMKTHYDEGNWECHSKVKNSIPGLIVFSTTHFTLFRAIVQRLVGHLLEKSIYFAGFLKRFTLTHDPKDHVLVWCFCDNQPAMISQLTLEMSSEHYERVIESETISVGFDQDIEISTWCRSPTSGITINPGRTVLSRAGGDVFSRGFLRKKEFRIHRDDKIDELVGMNFLLRLKSQDGSAMERGGAYSFYWRSHMPHSSSTNIYIQADHIDKISSS